MNQLMQVANYYSADDIRFETQPIPTINDDEILVKVCVCGLCGTDIAKIKFEKVEPKTVLGHEIAGVVVKVGKFVKDYVVGDRVYVAHHVPCFTCKYCRKGHYSLCKQFKESNVEPGGFSQYIRVSALHVKHTIGKLGENMTYEQGAMIEPVACCLYGINKMDIHPGDRVLIIGAGQMGIIQLQILKSKFLNEVMMSDINDFRLQQAVAFGADRVINSTKEDLVETIHHMTNGEGVDHVFISVGNGDLLTVAVKCIGRAGTILVFAPFAHSPILIDAQRFFEDEIKVIGSYSSSPFNYDEAKLLITENIIDVQKMITHRFLLRDLNKAINCAIDSTGESLKVMIFP